MKEVASIFLKAINIFNGNPIKIPTQLFPDLRQTIVNFIWINKQTTKTRIAKNNPV